MSKENWIVMRQIPNDKVMFMGTERECEEYAKGQPTTACCIHFPTDCKTFDEAKDKFDD